MLRGEVELRLGGRTCLLRPSFGRLVAAEGEVGSLFSLIERAAAGDVRMADVACLLWHCAETDLERGEFSDALMAEGFSRVLPIFRLLLSRMFGGA